jgi:integrase
MHNLVINQNGIYTFRRSILGKSIRVSLRTNDKIEALRIVEQVNSIFTLANPDNAKVAESIIHSAINKFQPTFKKERLAKVQSILGVTFEHDEGELLSVITHKYISEKLRLNAWAEKTYLGYRVIYQSLVDLLADKGIRAISHKDAQFIKDTLQKLPSNLSKKREYRGKPISQVLKLDIPESHLMSIKTINTMLGCYSELFKWAVKNGYVSVNVFDSLHLKDNRKARDLRAPLTPADLIKVFSDKAILQPKKDWQQWIPVLGLYTGARLNELCQLQKKDVIKVDGIWCISINDDGVEQLVKSTSSKRVVPLHRNIIAMGFVNYVMDKAGNQQTRIFSDLTLLNERFSHTPSRWFSSIKNRVLEDSDKKSFHSLRHTFVDYLYNKLKLQGNPLVKVLVGHTDNEITSGVYGSSFSVADLDSIIQKVNFEEFGVNIAAQTPWST